MKTNHRRAFTADRCEDRMELLKSFLKTEGNHHRRQMDRLALAQMVNGNDGALFALSDMGNPWHWD